MFAWPTCELTDYELKHVRYYKQPKLNAQGNETGEMWPGVLKRVYTVQLYNQNLPDIARFNNGPVFEDRVLISRRSRVFGLTFSGDVADWYLNIETASGEKYTNSPCLVSALGAGSYYNANSLAGSPNFSDAEVAINLLFSSVEHFGVMVEPNYQLLPNESLIFRGEIAKGLPPERFSQLAIGIHAWEFPGMGYSKKVDGSNV
jgi:hypothetical protein